MKSKVQGLKREGGKKNEALPNPPPPSPPMWSSLLQDKDHVPSPGSKHSALQLGLSTQTSAEITLQK